LKVLKKLEGSQEVGRFSRGWKVLKRLEGWKVGRLESLKVFWRGKPSNFMTF
jgi:hypothetical protein